MKKYLIVLFSFILLVCGCSKEEVDVETETYNNYLNEIKKINKSSDDISFDVTFDYERFNDKELRYKVIIDNVREDVYDIEALAYHDKETNDIYPSIGIFDEKEKLEVGKKPSGIILYGFIKYDGDINDFKCKIKVLIKYKNKDKKNKTVYYVK